MSLSLLQSKGRPQVVKLADADKDDDVDDNRFILLINFLFDLIKSRSLFKMWLMMVADNSGEERRTWQMATKSTGSIEGAWEKIVDRDPDCIAACFSPKKRRRK